MVLTPTRTVPYLLITWQSIIFISLVPVGAHNSVSYRFIERGRTGKWSKMILYLSKSCFGCLRQRNITPDNDIPHFFWWNLRIITFLVYTISKIENSQCCGSIPKEHYKPFKMRANDVKGISWLPRFMLNGTYRLLVFIFNWFLLLVGTYLSWYLPLILLRAYSEHAARLSQ